MYEMTNCTDNDTCDNGICTHYYGTIGGTLYPGICEFDNATD